MNLVLGVKSTNYMMITCVGINLFSIERKQRDRKKEGPKEPEGQLHRSQPRKQHIKLHNNSSALHTVHNLIGASC